MISLDIYVTAQNLDEAMAAVERLMRNQLAVLADEEIDESGQEFKVSGDYQDLTAEVSKVREL